MIDFQCSSCEQSLEVDDPGAGLTLACPACGADILVPKPAIQDSQQSVLKFVREQAEHKASLKMYYAAADLAREYMGPLADATKAEREQLALAYEQQGREAEARRAQQAVAPIVNTQPMDAGEPVEVKHPSPERVEPVIKLGAKLRTGKPLDRPLRVYPKRQESVPIASSRFPSQEVEGFSSLSPIVQTGWRLLCGYGIVGFIGLFVLDSELRAKFDQLHQLSTMTPQSIFAFKIELENPFSARSALLEIISWATDGLLGVVAVCAIIALVKDQVKPGLALLGAAAVSFAILYFAAICVVHNRTQPMIDEVNQQLQQMQQSLGDMMQQMQQLIPPHR